MNVINKILFGILAMIVIFAASAFGMYKYNQTRTFKNLASQGKQYMIQKNYDKSIELFNRALNYKNDSSIQKNLILAKSLKQEDEKQKNIYKNIQKQSDKEITYNQALQIVANKYPESSFKPVQEVVPMITLKKFLTDDELNKFYIFYGHDTFDDSDFQDLILLDKKTGSISQLSPDGVVH